MRNKYFKGISFLFILLPQLVCGQNIPVVMQAESGTLGTDFRVVDTLGTKSVTIKTDVVNTLNPGNTNRVISFDITFPDSGTYNLYAHILVGPNTYADDSYFYAKAFGAKAPSLDDDWMRANGLAGVGYSGILDVVDGAGGAQSGIWKWVNMSKYLGDGTPVSFRVELGALTKTFQIGARENGLYFDKFVFGRAGLYFTVSNLNKGEAGSKQLPGDIPLGTPIAAGKSKFLGCGWDYIQAPYFGGYWNQLTPGNAGKWGSVEGTRDVMNWTVLDSAYKIARKYHMLFKEHTLIWGAQQPSWIGALDSATQRQEIESWFSAIAARYDTIEYIDVVNEPMNNAPDGMVPWGTTQPNVNYAKALGGKGASGWEWVLTAFRLARQYFPKSKLILNEYNVINNATATQKYLQIINLLKAENLIDGIGEQAHAFTTYNVSAATLKSNLDALAATGIPIYLTEVDIDGLTDLAQLQEMQRVFPIFWEHPSVNGITLWGFRYGVWRNDQGAYLITNEEIERPALTWLKAYVNDTLTLAQSITVTSAGNKDTVYVGNSIQMSSTALPSNTTIPNVTWSVNSSIKANISSAGKLTATALGKVIVTATAWDGSGKTGSREITIVNQPTGILVASNPEEIFVRPNPAYNGEFTIEGIDGISHIELLDLMGRKVGAYNNFKGSSVNIQSNANPGIYVIRLFDGQKAVYKRIILK